MEFFFLYFIAPPAVSFLVQSMLCRIMKKGILRHGALVLLLISIIIGVSILLTQCGDIFGGLGAIAAVLWFVNACGVFLGYGTAWLIFLVTKKSKNRKQGE